jgi:hypothetical protein
MSATTLGLGVPISSVKQIKDFTRWYVITKATEGLIVDHLTTDSLKTRLE